MPLSSQPPSVRVAGPIGCATEAARKSPSPKISAWARSGNHDPICRAWLPARPMHHAVFGHPRASSISTRMYVGTSNS